MRKTEIKLLAFKSFTRGKIDSKKVKLFSAKMKRKELRDYIRFLKLIDTRTKVLVEVADLNKLDKSYLRKIEKLYPGKQIEISQNPDLILGLRITNDDLIYDYNLKNNMENIIEQI